MYPSINYIPVNRQTRSSLLINDAVIILVVVGTCGVDGSPGDCGDGSGGGGGCKGGTGGGDCFSVCDSSGVC